MTDLPTVVAALLPVAAALLLLQSTRWDRDADVLPPALLVALAVGVGVGLGSCSYFAALVAFGGARAGVIAVDVVVFGAAAALAWSRRGARPRGAPAQSSRLERGLAAAVLLAALAAAAAFAANTLAGPHGEWDAWAIWNLRARWLFRAGPDWWTAFTEQTIHGDYPLLLPGAVARLWLYGGGDSSAVPAALAGAYAAALALLLYGVLTALRGRAQGLLGVLCLLGTPLFLRSAAWQYADIPLAYYTLAALALLAARDRDPNCGPTALIWAGVAAGLAAWTKNEGLMLLLCLALVRGGLALARRQSIRGPLTWFLAGLAPVAAEILYFKLTLAPASYLGHQNAAELLARIADPDRYWVIARAAAVELANAGAMLAIALAVYLAVLGRTRDAAARRAAGAVTLTLTAIALGYGAIYVITPADLEWQLAHSLDRLVLQLWPSALFVFFLYAASPTEVAAPASTQRRDRQTPSAAQRRRARRRLRVLSAANLTG